MSDEESSQYKAIRGKWKVLERLLKGSGNLTTAVAKGETLQRKEEYEAFNRKLNDMRFGKYAFFLNYGYVPNENQRFSDLKPNEHQFDVDANSRRLVYEVIGDCPIDNLDVLDVSCGRGSVPVVLRDHFQPRSYLGIDLSTEAVAFCRQHHQQEGFEFEEGDAESLPVESGSRDVVINIESSHNYPRAEEFFSECYRVLRPDGWFLYTDLLAPVAFELYLQKLREMGFTVARDADITSNVLLSCRDIAEKRLKAYREPAERTYMSDFLAAPGSKTHRAMEEGLLRYRLFTFRKTAEAT